MIYLNPKAKAALEIVRETFVKTHSMADDVDKDRPPTKDDFFVVCDSFIDRCVVNWRWDEQQKDGGIIGDLVDDDSGLPVSTVRINGNGKISRGPEFVRKAVFSQYDKIVAKEQGDEQQVYFYLRKPHDGGRLEPNYLKAPNKRSFKEELEKMNQTGFDKFLEA